MPREIQAVEISCFIHATENAEMIFRILSERLAISQAPETEELEGHFGNRILHVRYHLTGEEATTAFRNTLLCMGSERRSELLAKLEESVDEHNVLYIRLGKQEFVKGNAVLSQVDPIRIRVKPKGFLMKTGARSFYTRLLNLAND